MSIPASAVFEDDSHLDEMSENAKLATAFLKALGHEGRLMILCYLASGEKSVTALEDLLSLRQPAVSQQLARLRSDNIISARRDGKTIYYSISDERARRMMELVYEMFCENTPKD
ncbi:MAG TPA: metalloregulator ArsR/SmtB family transcription factor [Hyphomicrobiaceae bacterium]|nr:metalloregulator ArsR/SmtB family transcription factor [Hyphomicrobiaceae bacterium]